jgi:hypothetical protein
MRLLHKQVRAVVERLEARMGRNNPQVRGERGGGRGDAMARVFDDRLGRTRQMIATVNRASFRHDIYQASAEGQRS